MIEKFLAKLTGLYTREDVELAILERCRKLKQVEEKERWKTLEKLTKSIKRLLAAHILTKHRFLGIFPLLTKRGDFLWVVAKIPQATSSISCNPYFEGGEIIVIDPAWLSIAKGRIGFLFFDVKGSDVYIIDIYVQDRMRCCGIGSFLLRLLEYLTINLSANRIIGELSPVDLPNRQTQVAFYSKNGYTVSFSNQARESGWIEKKLNRSHLEYPRF